MLRLWDRIFARHVKKERKKGWQRGRNVDSRGKKLTFRLESVEPAVPLPADTPFSLHPSRSRRKTGGNSCAEIRKERKGCRRMEWREGVATSERERKRGSIWEEQKRANDRWWSALRVDDSAKFAHATNRFAFERRYPRRKDEVQHQETISRIGGVDYDPPYPLTPRSIARTSKCASERLWINRWDGRFILIRINANLSTDVYVRPTQVRMRTCVPFYFAVTLDPLELSSS